MYIYIYIYVYIHIHIYIYTYQGFDSVRFLILTGGMPEPTGTYPRNLDSDVLIRWILILKIDRRSWLREWSPVLLMFTFLICTASPHTKHPQTNISESKFMDHPLWP